MTDENKSQLSEEEIIARKVKIRRIISRFLIAIGAISLIIFIVLAFLTRGNIQTQTAIDTQELRSKLKNIIAIQRRYYENTGELAEIKFLGRSKEIERYSPNLDGNFKYKFERKTGLATGIEKDASHDVNGDADGKDGLTLSINWESGGTDGSDFFWTEEDKSDFERRRASIDIIEIE